MPSIPGGLVFAAAARLAIAGLLLAAATARAGIEPAQALATSRAAIGSIPGAYDFTDTAGRHVSLASYRGKPLVVSFVYTGCSQVCPATTRFLARAVREARSAAGPDAFNVVSIGFNVPLDNPQSLAVFARQQGVDDARWSFLTPEAGAPERLARDFGFTYAAQSGGFDHLSQLTILDGSGRIRAQVYGDSFALPMLVGPLRELALGEPVAVNDASALLERVRLVCTVYDPASGRYRLDYRLFIEVAAGLSVLVTVAVFLVRERRRARAGCA
jgi:protein SCO1/2